MRALVTGGLGFVGWNLCKELVKQQWEVTVVDDLSSGNRANKIHGVIYHIESLETGPAEYFMERYDVVFHVAAVPRVAYSVAYPVETTSANVVSTVRALDFIRKHNPEARVIYSSSSSVYGDTKQLPTPPDHLLNPQSPYALQKAEGEYWCRLFSRLYGLDTVCLRYFNVMGPGSRYGGAYSTVLSAWLYYLYVDRSVSPFLEGDGTQTRDFCSVNNVVQANILAATYDSALRGQPFNVAQGSSMSLLECKDLLEKISGQQLPLENRPPRQGDIKHTLADISETQSVLGYEPEVDFEAQLTKMAHWYRDKYAQETQ
jgi:UDP-glucose 4-epimerase